MRSIVEINLQTGEKTEREMTQWEIEVLSTLPEPAEVPPIDPVDKLKMFLTTNPDVLKIVQDPPAPDMQPTAVTEAESAPADSPEPSLQSAAAPEPTAIAEEASSPPQTTDTDPQ